MMIQNWSDDIVLAEVADEPAFTEEMTTLLEQLAAEPRDVVVSFSEVDFLNSSNIAKMLKLRKMVTAAGRRLVLCGVNSQVWGIFLVTGLDKIFEYTDDVSTALATLQLGSREQSR